MIIDNQLIYDKARVNHYSDLNIETKTVVDWTDSDKKVLELGCHTGYLSEWLQKQGCEVTGIDLNSQALEIAKPYLTKAIFADLETEEFWSQIKGNSYDTITCMHVLEHLTNPWETLQKLSQHLKSNGEIIIALPNINNAKDRYNMLFGEFNYTVEGVMDKTHLRFFNQKTTRELIDSAGLSIIDYFSPWQVNPFHHFIDHLPFLYKFKGIFNAGKVPRVFKNNKNLTDVVMMFRCKLK